MSSCECIHGSMDEGLMSSCECIHESMKQIQVGVIHFLNPH